MAKDATEWLIDKIARESKQVQRRLAQLKISSMARFHIRHGAEVMAVSMGIKRLAHVSADRLYQWSASRYAKESRKHKGKPCPLETLIRLQMFHYGRDIVLKQMKGGAG